MYRVYKVAIQETKTRNGVTNQYSAFFFSVLILNHLFRSHPLMILLHDDSKQDKVHELSKTEKVEPLNE